MRLIFNGQVLRPDTKTLHACGMFADCVVHCLVRNTPAPLAPPASSAPAAAPAAATANGGAAAAARPMPSFGDVAAAAVAAVTGDRADAPAAERCLNLVYLAMTTLLASLMSAWYMRFQYAQLFNAQSTVGLLLVSGMFSACALTMLWMNGRLATTTTAATANPPTMRVVDAQNDPNARLTDAVFPTTG